MKLGAFFFEILPLLAFFAGYQYSGLIAAAVCAYNPTGPTPGPIRRPDYAPRTSNNLI